MKKFIRGGSIFQKTFIGLMLLSLLMAVFFMAGANRTAGRLHREQLAVTNLGRLQQAVYAYSSSMGMLRQSMSQVMWSADLSGYMITPYAGDENQINARSYHAAQTLEELVTGNSLVQGAYLYTPLTGKLIDGHKNVWEAHQAAVWPVVEAYLQGETAPASGGRPVVQDFFYEGRMFLMCSLRIPAPVGVLVYEIDQRALVRTMGLAGEDGFAEIVIYDAERRPVFGNALAYPYQQPDWEDKSSFVVSGDKEAQRSATRGYYRYDTVGNGWVYLMPLNTASLRFGLGDAARLWLPAVLAFLVLSACFAWYISKSVYAPVNRLMNLVTQTPDRQNRISDTEIDYLEGAYTDALGEREQLKGLIGQISPEVIGTMLRNLLDGRQLTEQRVREILQGCGDPLPMHGQYVVMVTQLTELPEEPIRDTEINLFLLSIRNFAAALENDRYKVFSVRAGRLRVALILCFDQGCPVVEVKREYLRIASRLLLLAGRLPHPLKVERGDIYPGIMDIRLAFREAVEKLNYSEYYEGEASLPAEGAGEAGETEEAAECLVSRNYVSKQAQAAVASAAAGDMVQAPELVSRLLHSIDAGAPSEEGYRAVIQLLLDTITKKVVSLPLQEADLRRIEGAHISSRVARLGSRAEVAAAVLAYSTAALELIGSYSGQSRYRYVEKAKEYIAEHYADSSLSLTDIGTNIGISASYLSELFTEIAGEKFSVYLSRFRVQKARQLLRTTKATSREIGFACGFNSVQNFNRVFKKITDVTPGQYRAEQG